MRRGTVVIAGERGAYTGKPRPWLIVQRSIFLDDPASITACPISATAIGAMFRVPVLPDADNGLEAASLVLADKVTTLRPSAVQSVAGQVDDATMVRLDEALRLWLDL